MWHHARSLVSQRLLRLPDVLALLRRRALGKRVRWVLSAPGPTECSRPEAAFEQLQAEARPVAEYGYDPLSTWKRGATRAAVLLGLSSGLTVPGARILEAAWPTA